MVGLLLSGNGFDQTRAFALGQLGMIDHAKFALLNGFE